MPIDDPAAPFIALVAGLLFIPVLLGVASRLGLYTMVQECEAQVYTLFGKVLGTIDEAGLRFPIAQFGLKALLVPCFGKLPAGRYHGAAPDTICGTTW